MTLTSHYGKFNQENMYQNDQNLPCFGKDMTKTFWCVFRFTVLTAVHLQNAQGRVETVKFVGVPPRVLSYLRALAHSRLLACTCAIPSPGRK